MSTNWINAENMAKALKEQMNKEMLEAAEPIIQQAVKNAEKEMRFRLSAMIVSLVENRFDVFRDGRDICIKVLSIPRDKQ